MRNAALAIAVVLLAACASYSGYGLHPGVSTEDDVRRAMGAPAAVYPDPDGGRELAYPRGPMGNETFMAHVAPDGKLRSIDQVLGEDTYARIQPGMSEQDVLHLLGPPREGMSYQLSRRHSWDWKFIDAWGYPAIFSVTFDAQGRVVGTFTQRIEPRERF